ncbi:hypothetical protein Tco_0551967 [Tanacetum coccineum]
MCYRAVDVIPGLLRARNELEEDLEEQVSLMREKDALVKKLKNMLVLSWIFVFVVVLRGFARPTILPFSDLFAQGCTDTRASEINKLELQWELRGVHSTFYVLNLKKCLSDKNLIIPPNEIRLVNMLHFIEDPIEIIECEVKHLKQSCTLIVKVR